MKGRRKKNKDDITCPNMYDTSIENLKIASQSYCSCLDASFSREPAGRNIYSSRLFPGKPRDFLKSPVAGKGATLFSLVSLGSIVDD